jgi:hypothetical protein
VVVLSAGSEIAKPIKADELLHKPITAETLLGTIQKFVRRRSA